MYRKYNKKYLEKKYKDPLPPLSEDERIYFNVPYTARQFASYAHCGFDSERKLWFTGHLNRELEALVELYGVNEEYTSKKALKLLEEELEKRKKAYKNSSL